MQFPLLTTAPLSWQDPMHFLYCDSNFTIAIIAILILLHSTEFYPCGRYILGCAATYVQLPVQNNHGSPRTFYWSCNIDYFISSPL